MDLAKILDDRDESDVEIDMDETSSNIGSERSSSFNSSKDTLTELEPYVRKSQTPKQTKKSVKRINKASFNEDERQKVNSRERKRMHDLNHALVGLREVLSGPHGPNVRKMSKINTLVTAREEILRLKDEVRRLQLCSGQQPGMKTSTPFIPASPIHSSIPHPSQGIRNPDGEPSKGQSPPTSFCRSAIPTDFRLSLPQGLCLPPVFPNSLPQIMPHCLPTSQEFFNSALLAFYAGSAPKL